MTDWTDAWLELEKNTPMSEKVVLTENLKAKMNGSTPEIEEKKDDERTVPRG